MGIIKQDEIAGYLFTNGEVLCAACATQEQDSNAEEHEILTEEMTTGDDRYFCDLCKKQF
jgi:hypothetical protein